ncbi:MAG TPA: zf-TFIIB domain-containing protein [Polyangiaceae bacterium]
MAGDACDVCGTRRLAVDEKRVGAHCPRCAGLHLGPVEIGTIVVQGCAHCGGLFVAASEWDAILDLSPRDPLPEPLPLRPSFEPPIARVEESIDTHPYRGEISAAVRERESKAPPISVDGDVACPVCRTTAERFEFGGISQVFVDVCNLHGIWLDAGELAKVVRHARENPIFSTANQPKLEELVTLHFGKPPSLAQLVLHAIVRYLHIP